MNPAVKDPASNPANPCGPSIYPTITGAKTAIAPGTSISWIAASVAIETHLPYSGTPYLCSKTRFARRREREYRREY